MSLAITHNAGFFSCCNVKLRRLVEFVMKHGKLPDVVDSSQQFDWYKPPMKKNTDITYEYFNNYEDILIDNAAVNVAVNEPLTTYYDLQYDNFQTIAYEKVCPFIKKYFSPSKQVLDILSFMERKYGFTRVGDTHYDNTCVLFYRGNDKNRECSICGYEEYIAKANEVLAVNPRVRFLIQSDETGFIETLTAAFPNNSFIFRDEIRHIPKCNSSVDIMMAHSNFVYSKYFLAITLIMAQCKYVVCGSGNCSLWLMFYRGNANNVLQNLEGVWIYPNGGWK